MKSVNLLISNTILNFWTWSIFKHYSLRPFSCCTIIMQTKLHHFFKADNILSNSRIPLFHLKELNLFLATHVLWEVRLQKESSKHITNDLCTHNFYSLACIIPPVFGLLFHHMSTKLYFLLLYSSHHLKDILNPFEPCLCTIEIMSSRKGWQIILLKLPQST